MKYFTLCINEIFMGCTSWLVLLRWIITLELWPRINKITLDLLECWSMKHSTWRNWEWFHLFSRNLRLTSLSLRLEVSWIVIVARNFGPLQTYLERAKTQEVIPCEIGQHPPCNPYQEPFSSHYSNDYLAPISLAQKNPSILTLEHEWFSYPHLITRFSVSFQWIFP